LGYTVYCSWLHGNSWNNNSPLKLEYLHWDSAEAQHAWTNYFFFYYVASLDYKDQTLLLNIIKVFQIQYLFEWPQYAVWMCVNQLYIFLKCPLGYALYSIRVTKIFSQCKIYGYQTCGIYVTKVTKCTLNTKIISRTF
jgi:hypothetical protein